MVFGATPRKRARCCMLHGVTALLASIARLHIVAIGALGTLTFAWALCGVRAVDLALLSACDWFVVNLINRVTDSVEDQRNGIVGADVVARHPWRTAAVAVFVLVASLVASALLAPQTVPWRIGFHVLGALYNHRLLPRLRRRDGEPARVRIKEMTLWKNVASATGFLITCFALPLSSLPWRADVTTTTVTVTLAFFFFFELGYEVLYDLRDVDGDADAGVRTWPVLFGPAGGAKIAVAQTVVAFAIVVAGFASAALPWRVAVMGAAPLMQLVVVGPRLPLFGRKNRIDSALCIGVTWLGVVLLGTYHLWEFFHLPGSTG
jgi:4-hydroxybenzoate polyprenyltransferase